MFIFNADGGELLDTYYGSRQPIMDSVVAIFTLLFHYFCWFYRIGKRVIKNEMFLLIFQYFSEVVTEVDEIGDLWLNLN